MRKKSFFERITGIVKVSDENQESEELGLEESETETEGQLAIDMYQTPSEIVIKTMIAGVEKEDLDVSITRDMVIIKGKREESNDTAGNDYFHKELYWGAFSRTIILPQEIDVDASDAINKNGLLIIKMPKIDKNRQAKLKIKSV
ncbi:MAG: Hsp20/alpha crystallin family protein [Candidatus Paceibacterota bacterium]|jgi:HSP20 family protein